MVPDPDQMGSKSAEHERWYNFTERAKRLKIYKFFDAGIRIRDKHPGSATLRIFRSGKSVKQFISFY
jgi:hypothetical protein